MEAEGVEMHMLHRNCIVHGGGCGAVGSSSSHSDCDDWAHTHVPGAGHTIDDVDVVAAVDNHHPCATNGYGVDKDLAGTVARMTLGSTVDCPKRKKMCCEVSVIDRFHDNDDDDNDEDDEGMFGEIHHHHDVAETRIAIVLILEIEIEIGTWIDNGVVNDQVFDPIDHETTGMVHVHNGRHHH